MTSRRASVGRFAVALAVLVVGSLTACSGGGEEVTPEVAATTPAAIEAPSESPVVASPSASVAPDDLEAYANNLEREQFFELFSISAEEYTTPEAIADRYTALRSLWMNAGTSVQFSWDTVTNEEETIDDIMTAFDGPIIEGLFTDSAEAQAFVAEVTEETRPYVIRDFYWSDMGGDNPYEIDYELIDSTVVGGSVEEGKFIVLNTVKTTDNGGDTIAENRKTYGIDLWQDITRTQEVEFVNTSGTWKVNSHLTLTKEDNSHN